MSQDPFNPQVSSPGAYGTPPPKKGSLMWLWILLGVLGGGAVLACACCGIMGTMGQGVVESAMGTALKPALESNAVIQEHIGTINDCKADLKGAGQAGPELIPFKLKGSIGSGTANVKVSPDGKSIDHGTLKMEDGTTHDLVPPVVAP